MKIVARVVSLLAICALVTGTVMYERPLWVRDQQTHFRWWRSGVRSGDVVLPEGRIHFYEFPAHVAGAQAGSGIPLLLVNGLGGRAEEFAALAPRLAAQGFHVYVPDLLGFGASATPADSDYSVATEERVMLEFMDSQHLQRPELAGWSMGGWIALKLALDHPERVDRVAALDSAGIRYEDHVAAGLFAPKNAADVGKLIRAMSPTMKIPPAFVERAIIRRNAEGAWVVQRSLESMHSGRDLLDQRLPTLRTPLLLVWGAEDVLSPVQVGATMHQMVPQSVFATVQGCGHFAPVECSAAVAGMASKFFKAQPAMQGGEVQLSR